MSDNRIEEQSSAIDMILLKVDGDTKTGKGGALLGALIFALESTGVVQINPHYSTHSRLEFGLVEVGQDEHVYEEGADNERGCQCNCTDNVGDFDDSHS